MKVLNVIVVDVDFNTNEMDDVTFFRVTDVWNLDRGTGSIYMNNVLGQLTRYRNNKTVRTSCPACWLPFRSVFILPNPEGNYMFCSFHNTQVFICGYNLYLFDVVSPWFTKMYICRLAQVPLFILDLCEWTLVPDLFKIRPAWCRTQSHCLNWCVPISNPFSEVIEQYLMNFSFLSLQKCARQCRPPCRRITHHVTKNWWRPMSRKVTIVVPGEGWWSFPIFTYRIQARMASMTRTTADRQCRPARQITCTLRHRHLHSSVDDIGQYRIPHFHVLRRYGTRGYRFIFQCVTAFVWNIINIRCYNVSGDNCGCELFWLSAEGRDGLAPYIVWSSCQRFTGTSCETNP